MTSSRGASLGMDDALPGRPIGLGVARRQGRVRLTDGREPHRRHRGEALQIAVDRPIDALDTRGARGKRTEPRTKRWAVEVQLEMAHATLQRPLRKGEHVPYRLTLGTQHGELDDAQAFEDTRHVHRAPPAPPPHRTNE